MSSDVGLLEGTIDGGSLGMTLGAFELGLSESGEILGFSDCFSLGVLLGISLAMVTKVGELLEVILGLPLVNSSSC